MTVKEMFSAPGHPGLQQRLGKNCRHMLSTAHRLHMLPTSTVSFGIEVNSNDNDVRVNLSSGLHYGWAIEGWLVVVESRAVFVCFLIFLVLKNPSKRKQKQDSPGRSRWQRIQD